MFPPRLRIVATRVILVVGSIVFGACGGSSRATNTLGSSTSSPSATTIQAPAGTVSFSAMRVGETVRLDVAVVEGWSEPRSTNANVLGVSVHRSDTGWTVEARATAPGNASILSLYDPCTGVPNTTVCHAGRSGMGFTYLKVVVKR